jgi:serine/threonine protein kinase
MQFQYNSDYPATGSDGAEIPAEVREPSEFPRAQPISCARITTRIFHPSRNQVATVQNVLVRTAMRPVVKRTASATSMSSDGGMSSSSDESMAVDQPQDASSPGAATATVIEDNGHNMDDRAYWVQRTVREAIYGRVLLAVVLRRRQVRTDAPNDNAEWEVTTEHCAVKEMSWQHIRRERDRLAEDPIKEVSAMQYLKQWHTTVKAKASKPQDEPVDGVAASFKAILETNIMMPLDLLSDDRNLYSIMPYCDGGELFERLDLNERFSEEEARYWMHQVLNVSDN